MCYLCAGLLFFSDKATATPMHAHTHTPSNAPSPSHTHRHTHTHTHTHDKPTPAHTDRQNLLLWWSEQLQLHLSERCTQAVRHFLNEAALLAAEILKFSNCPIEEKDMSKVSVRMFLNLLMNHLEANSEIGKLMVSDFHPTFSFFQG